MPSCTCPDWRTHHIPCKHFFAVFQHRPSWTWNSLPKGYLESAYISTDTSLAAFDHQEISTDNGICPSQDAMLITESLPKKVFPSKINFL